MEKTWPNVAKKPVKGGPLVVNGLCSLSGAFLADGLCCNMLQYTFGTVVPWLGKWNIGGERFCAFWLVHFL
jgi:hypothetical protein